MGERGSTRPAGGMARHVPALAWLPGYQTRWLPRDLVAGVEGGLWYANAEFVHGQAEDQLRTEGLLGSIDRVVPTVEAAVDQAVRTIRPG